MTSKRPLVLGLALALLSILLATAGAGLGGPRAPAAAPPLLGRALLWLALPVAILGGTLVAVWLGRRAAAAEEKEA